MCVLLTRTKIYTAKQMKAVKQIDSSSPFVLVNRGGRRLLPRSSVGFFNRTDPQFKGKAAIKSSNSTTGFTPRRLSGFAQIRCHHWVWQRHCAIAFYFLDSCFNRCFHIDASSIEGQAPSSCSSSRLDLSVNSVFVRLPSKSIALCRASLVLGSLGGSSAVLIKLSPCFNQKLHGLS